MRAGYLKDHDIDLSAFPGIRNRPLRAAIGLTDLGNSLFTVSAHRQNFNISVSAIQLPKISPSETDQLPIFTVTGQGDLVPPPFTPINRQWDIPATGNMNRHFCSEDNSGILQELHVTEDEKNSLDSIQKIQSNAMTRHPTSNSGSKIKHKTSSHFDMDKNLHRTCKPTCVCRQRDYLRTSENLALILKHERELESEVNCRESTFFHSFNINIFVN